MFTGIVTEMGKIIAVERISAGVRLKIQARESLRGLKVGDSMAINGACQTVVASDQDAFSVEAMEETLKRTTLGRCRVGDRVNLENSLSLHDFLGGHLVSGHVDGVGVIRAKVPRAGDILLRIQVASHLLAQIYERGSVAVDGVSLTVVAVGKDEFSVTLIPYTCRVTTLGWRQIGHEVNLETDMMVKAVQRLLEPYLESREFTRERLQELGF